MTTEFDPHTIIKELAEWERPRKSLPDFVGGSPGSIGTQSMEAPFAVLRVPCGNIAFHIVRHQRAEDYPCCEGRNWVPEPDVRVACEEIIKHLASLEAKHWHIFWAVWEEIQQENGCVFEEAVLRAAAVWVKETP